MNNITAFIVDDEAHIIKTLKYYLEPLAQCEILGTANTIEEAVAAINQLQPNLLFLDIELPDGLGFDILKQLSYHHYTVIFITAHSHYAMQAIKASAFDFLLKPINEQELMSTLQRLSKAQQQHDIYTRIDTLENNLQANCNPRIVFRSADRYIVYEQEDILYIQAANTYVTVYTTEGNTLTISQPIKYYDELLGQGVFFRCHRSYLINLKHVKEIIKTDKPRILMANDITIPLASSTKSTLIARLLNDKNLIS